MTAPDRAPAAPSACDQAARHTHRLADHMTAAQIARAAGIARETVHRVLRADTPPGITARTAAALLAVPLPAGEPIEQQQQAATEHAHMLMRVMTQGAIAKAARVTPATVVRVLFAPELITARVAARIRAVKPPVPRSWGETRREALRLWRAGATREQISDLLRIPEPRVRDALTGLGGPRPSTRVWPPITSPAPRNSTRGRAA